MKFSIKIVLVSVIALFTSCRLYEEDSYYSYGHKLKSYSCEILDYVAQDVIAEIDYLSDVDAYIHYDGVQIPEKWSDYVNTVSIYGTVIKIGSSITVERNAVNSFFDEGAIWTINDYIGVRTYQKQVDTTWNVTLSYDNDVYRYLNELEAAGVFGYETSSSSKTWSVSVSGTSSEQSSYSSSFRTLADYRIKSKQSDYYPSYRHYGTFVTDVYLEDELYDTCTLTLDGVTLNEID